MRTKHMKISIEIIKKHKLKIELEFNAPKTKKNSKTTKNGTPGDMGMSSNDDLALAQASFQLSPQAQQNAKAKMLKSGSRVVCSSRTPF